MKHLIFLSFIFALALGPELTCAKSDRVKLRDVQVLTLTEGKWTTGRRSSPIKQLRCIGGYCKRASVSTAQCYNKGFDGRDVQWECKANLPSQYKFGRMEVACEGYDYPEDDYVLVGSCGLEYSIEEVNGPSPGNYFQSKFGSDYQVDSESSSLGTLIFIGAVIFFIYFACIRRPTRENDGTYPGTDDNYRPGASAPPPPGFRNDFYGDSCGGSSTRTDGPSCSSRGSSGSSSGPGFFSGMATGGLMGYLFGSSGTRSRYRESSYGDSYSRPSSSGYSGWSSSRGSSGGSSSSTGYASTSRR